jgi:AraC family transcriptional regulator
MTTPLALGRFLGASAHSLAFDGVAIAENIYSAGLVQATHAHDAALISLVLDGSATEEYGGRTRELSAQSLLFTPAYEMHGHVFRTPGRWLNIQFSSAWSSQVGEGRLRLPAAPVVLRSHPAVAWATRIRAEVRVRDAVSRSAIEGALILLAAELARLPVTGERVRPRWLLVVEEAIEASVGAPPSVGQLAELARVHPSHLLRAFRRYHGSTVANYVRQRRIARARTEVARGKRSLSAIALDAGFSDQSHFTRVFRQAFGETPGRYARSLRGR